MSDWKWAHAAWDEHFSPLREAGYTVERVGKADYWEIHERELRKHFPPEAFFDLDKLKSDHEREGQKKLEVARGGAQLEDRHIVRRQGELAASFVGIGESSSTYRMRHTNVHPAFRRRGLYRLILAGTIAYSRTLGFDTITSEHAPGNNPVLIAKLKAGFRIVSMDVSPEVGVSVILKYFHNPDHLAAYEFRTGLATLNPRLIRSGSSAMTLLAEQFLCESK